MYRKNKSFKSISLNDKSFFIEFIFPLFINQLNSENFTLFIENFKINFIHFCKIDDDLSLSFLLCLKEDLITLKETKRRKKTSLDKIIIMFLKCSF